MAAFDRFIIVLGALAWIAGMLIAAYGLGFAHALDRPYRPPNAIVALVLCGFVLWGVGLVSERVRRSVKR